MRMRACLIGGAVVGALSLPTWMSGQAAPVLPQKQPARSQAALANPPGTAKAVAALARFANGQLGQSAYDQRVAKVLGKTPAAKTTAKRLVQALEAMPVAQRAKVFPGTGKPESLTTQLFDSAQYQVSAAAKWGKALQPAATVLAPDPYDPGDKPQYELVYSGMKCDKTADADASDETAVYLNVLSPGGNNYLSNPSYLPAAGTTPASLGALSTANAGKAWSSVAWPGGWNSGIVIVTGVIEDNGDLEQRKQEIDLLVQFAISETDEDHDTPDRMEVLRRELDDALALLHLANPDRWSAKAVQVRKLTSAEYDALYVKPSTPSPVAHKLTAQHDPRGADYTLFFDIPPPNVSFKTVVVKIKEIEALGVDKDKAENKIADLGVVVSINANTGAEATRIFAANKNLVKPSWTIERDIQAGRSVSISLRVFDDDAPPSCGCTSAGGWPSSTCYTFCAAPAQKDQCQAFFSGYGYGGSPSYGGTCPRQQVQYDIHPLPNSGDGWFYSEYETLGFSFDLATNKIAGDVSGSPGTFTVLGTDGAGNRARIVFEVGTK